MTKRRFFKDGLSIFAFIAFIIAAIISIVSVVFPFLITDMTKQAINFDSQYKEADGSVRPAVVLAQLDVFIFALVIIVLLWGFALSGLFYGIKSREASIVAAGGSAKNWLVWILAGVVLILFCLLGVGLPQTVFDPTHKETLSRTFPLVHFAKNSGIGGILIVGIVGMILSIVVAWGFFSLIIILPRHLKESKLKTFLKIKQG